MIDRKIYKELKKLLGTNPAVALLGPRQVGKTTLAHTLVDNKDVVYLDLERPSDLAKLTDIEQFCAINSDKLLILDEVQRKPELFAPLRSIIDERRREGKKNSQFLLLGSASIELLKQVSETLAGRIAYCELHPLTLNEINADDINNLWYRGGFPDSFLSDSDEVSFEWRLNFIRTYLERDIPALGPRIPAETLRRFWTMLAHNQGATFNASSFARGLDVTGVTIARYLDLMVDLLLVRRLQPWTSNTGKRLVKAPKIYVRDSGLVHALLNINNINDLLGHPVLGGSWEGFVIENIIRQLPSQTEFGFYRTSNGDEVDLVINKGNKELWAVEIKRSSAPTVSKGFYRACEDIKPNRKIVVHSGKDSFPLSKEVQALSLNDMLNLCQE